MQLVMENLGIPVESYDRCSDSIFEMSTPLNPIELSTTTRPFLTSPTKFHPKELPEDRLSSPEPEDDLEDMQNLAENPDDDTQSMDSVRSSDSAKMLDEPSNDDRFYDDAVGRLVQKDIPKEPDNGNLFHNDELFSAKVESCGSAERISDRLKSNYSNSLAPLVSLSSQYTGNSDCDTSFKKSCSSVEVDYKLDSINDNKPDVRIPKECQCVLVMRKLFETNTTDRILTCDLCGCFLRFFIHGSCGVECSIGHIFCSCFDSRGPQSKHLQKPLANEQKSKIEFLLGVPINYNHVMNKLDKDLCDIKSESKCGITEQGDDFSASGLKEESKCISAPSLFPKKELSNTSDYSSANRCSRSASNNLNVLGYPDRIPSHLDHKLLDPNHPNHVRNSNQIYQSNSRYFHKSGETINSNCNKSLLSSNSSNSICECRSECSCQSKSYQDNVFLSRSNHRRKTDDINSDIGNVFPNVNDDNKIIYLNASSVPNKASSYNEVSLPSPKNGLVPVTNTTEKMDTTEKINGESYYGTGLCIRSTSYVSNGEDFTTSDDESIDVTFSECSDDGEKEMEGDFYLDSIESEDDINDEAEFTTNRVSNPSCNLNHSGKPMEETYPNNSNRVHNARTSNNFRDSSNSNQFSAAAKESRELMSIWYRSFCDENSVASPADSAARSDDKTDENVRQLWFWGCDDVILQKEKLSKNCIDEDISTEDADLSGVEDESVVLEIESEVLEFQALQSPVLESENNSLEAMQLEEPVKDGVMDVGSPSPPKRVLR